MSTTSVHLIVSGRVQGVFFRAHTKEVADSLHLLGWVKNLPTGEVEIYAEGEIKNLEKFIAWCKVGPPAAKVSKVKIDWRKEEKDLESFSPFKVIG